MCNNYYLSLFKLMVRYCRFDTKTFTVISIKIPSTQHRVSLRLSICYGFLAAHFSIDITVSVPFFLNDNNLLLL